MSATGRGTVRDPKDFYATPWEAFAPLLNGPLRDLSVSYWDPCAGDGRLILWLSEAGRMAGGADIEPKPSAAPIATMDFLQDHTRRSFILTNPPFSIAFEFAQHALDVAPEVMLLLRLGFLGSFERSRWLKANEPNALFVLSSRPSFVMACRCKVKECRHSWFLPKGTKRPKVCAKCNAEKPGVSTSDNADYAWFYWGRRYQGMRHL